MTQNEFLELCAKGNYEQVINAIRSGIDVNQYGDIKGSPVSPIFIAISERNDDAAEALLEYGANCAEGFIAAVISEDTDAVKMLIDLGADVNSNDNRGHNALLSAVMMNKPEMVSALIELGADVNTKVSGDYNVLTYASIMMADMEHRNGEKYDLDPEIVKILMRNGSDYENALIIAIKTNSENFARTVIENGADLNFKDTEGRSAIMYSVMTGGGLLRLLLENGADPNIPSDKGRTPLMLAAIDEEADIEIINTLLEFGADVNKQDDKGFTALMWAAASDEKKPDVMIPALIRTGAMRAEGFEKWFALSSLYMAIKHETHFEIIRTLIKGGADVNIRNHKGVNALMCAIMNNDEEAADILTEAGAEFNFEIV